MQNPHPHDRRRLVGWLSLAQLISWGSIFYTSEDLSPYLRSAPLLLIGLFVILMMAVTVALPAHMVSLLGVAALALAQRLALEPDHLAG